LPVYAIMRESFRPFFRLPQQITHEIFSIQNLGFPHGRRFFSNTLRHRFPGTSACLIDLPGSQSRAAIKGIEGGRKKAARQAQHRDILECHF
jgi:hypothetical protein